MLLESFREAFAVNTVQVWLFLLCCLAFLALLIISPFIIKAAWKRKVKKRTEEKYRLLADIHNLGPEDEIVLNKLSAYLKDPRKKYVLITNARAYLAALESYIAEYKRFRIDERALCQKLEIAGDMQYSIPENTAFFKTGCQLVIMTGEKSYVTRVLAVEENSFITEGTFDPYVIKPGTDIILLYPFGNGLTVGDTVVDKVKDNKIKLVGTDMEKPENIEYYNLNVKVHIRNIDSGSGYIEAVLKSIVGKEFNIKAEKHNFKRRDDIKIFFSSEKGSVPVNAEIVAVKKKHIIADTGYFN